MLIWAMKKKNQLQFQAGANPVSERIYLNTTEVNKMPNPQPEQSLQKSDLWPRLVVATLQVLPEGAK